MPGISGPWPLRPKWYCAPSACAVTPCQLPPSPTISNFPVYTLAIFMAASLLSPPVERKKALSRPVGRRLQRRSPRLTTGGDTIPEKRWSRAAAWSVIVCTISGCPWPSKQDICPDVKSSTLCPEAVYT